MLTTSSPTRITFMVIAAMLTLAATHTVVGSPGCPSCAGKSTHSQASPAASLRTATTTSAQSLSVTSLDPYFAIQRALAADRIDGITGHSNRLARSFDLAAVADLAQSRDLASARQHFDTISRALTTRVREHGITGGQVYLATCPMAFDNRGATWLQVEPVVANPYFGSRMFRCGSLDPLAQPN